MASDPISDATRPRIAALADLDALEAIETSVFQSDRLSRRSLRYYIGAPTALVLVLDIGGVVAGDAVIAFRRNATRARLYSLAIASPYGGRGYGRLLLSACETAACDRGATVLRLEVREDNLAAIGLYRSAGYEEFGQYLDFYEDGATALRFEKSIAPLGRAGGEPAEG